MKIAIISQADINTGYKYNIQILIDEIYTTESFYSNNLFDALRQCEELECKQLYIREMQEDEWR